jgi:beta-lactamase regulating signal transducer with metallopeptidase domain
MEMISRLATAFLINALWQIAVLFVITYACSRALQRMPARLRHNLWLGSLALCLLLPLFSAFNFRLPWALSVRQQIAQLSSAQPAPGAASVAPRPAEIPAELADLFTSLGRNSTPWVGTGSMALLALALLYRIARLSRSVWKTRTLIRTATADSLNAGAVGLVARCERELGTQGVKILFSNAIASPLAAGTRRPVIILPEGIFDKASADVVLSALGHEMAHIRRHDFLINQICELLLLPIWLNPLTAIIKKQIDQTRELACDEMVTEHLLTPRVYARSLLVLAKAAFGFARPGYTLGVLDADILEERIMKLINRKRKMNRQMGYVMVIAAVVVLGVTTVAASGFSFQMGQDKPYTFTHGQEKNGASIDLASVIGRWEGTWSGDRHAMTLNIKQDGDKLVGTTIFYRWVKSGDGMKLDGQTGDIPLEDLSFDGKILRFKTRYRTKNGESVIVNDYQVSFADDNHATMRTTGQSDDLAVKLTKAN